MEGCDVQLAELKCCKKVKLLMEQVLRDRKIKRDEKEFSPPHKSIGAMLLPGMAVGKGEQL